MKGIQRLVITNQLTKARGFSLIELFIALAIGVALFAGVMVIFVNMKTTTTETSGLGELQENGRFALSILTDDLMRQDFWGDYTGTFDLASLNSVVQAAPSNECTGDGINNGTFPIAAGHFRTLWGQTVTQDDPMGCFSASAKAKKGSDLIQIKRVVSEPMTVAPVGNYYLTTNISYGNIFAGGTIPTISNSQTWEYQHHVYYVTEQTQGNISVPVLMKGRLTNSMTFSPMIDGIEMIRFMYGVDTDTDVDDKGIVNAFISADNMTSALWDNSSNSKIIAVKVYVLARSILPDNKYTNTNTYLLGDLSYSPNDNYRRMLFTSTVTLFNARVDSW